MWEPSYFSFVGCCFEKPTQLFFHWSREREENDPRRDRPKVSTTTRAKRPDRVLVASCWNYLRLLTSSCYTHRERERERRRRVKRRGFIPFSKKKTKKQNQIKNLFSFISIGPTASYYSIPRPVQVSQIWRHSLTEKHTGGCVLY